MGWPCRLFTALVPASSGTRTFEVAGYVAFIDHREEAADLLGLAVCVDGCLFDHLAESCDAELSRWQQSALLPYVRVQATALGGHDGSIARPRQVPFGRANED